MAGNGTFKAKVVLKLDNCSTIPPFSDDVEFEGLNGTKSFEEIITVEQSSPCVDITSDCCHNPRLLILRPASVQFSTLVPVKKDDGTLKTASDGKPETKWEVDPSWKEVKDSGISRDQLAKLLAFATPDETPVSLGRPQFYFDGLINLLLGSDSTRKAPAKLSFSLVVLYFDSAGNTYLDEAGAKYLDKTGKTITDPEKFPKIVLPITKKLHAITVQFIAAYAPAPKPPEPKPGKQKQAYDVE